MFKYILPDNKNNPKKCETAYHSIIIIGANGSGKSRIGAWIEKQDPDNVHRIGAQRSLEFGDYIQQKSYEKSSRLLLFGTDNNMIRHHDGKWNWRTDSYTTMLLNDYEIVLSTLLALKNKEEEEFVEECRKKEKNKEPHNNVPEMVTDKLKKIWNLIFPHRNIDIKDGKVVASICTNNYEGKNMSDGERVALYLIAQALCVPENKTIIIDEPEIHLHHSILEKLWKNIELERKDCLFIYITHDTQFASLHRDSEKYWIKSFDGEKWEYEKINNDNMPEQLLLDILGNRKSVLFIEGTNHSYDAKLYSEIYDNYYVIPCGSCSSVISQTKAMKSNKQLHHLSCYGLIDRDFRSDSEIKKLKEQGIYSLKVAEVENLFLVEEILKIINKILSNKNEEKIDSIKKYVIKRFEEQKNDLISRAVISELKFQLDIITIEGKDKENIKENLNNCLHRLSIDKIYENIEKNFNVSGDYQKILELFNEKGLRTSIGHYLGLCNKEYSELVLRNLQSDHREEIINSFLKYLPEEIPR